MAGHLVVFIVRMKIWKDNRGQDMLEYACFIAAICLMYAAVTPSIAASVCAIFTKIASTATAAGSTS